MDAAVAAVDVEDDEGVEGEVEKKGETGVAAAAAAAAVAGAEMSRETRGHAAGSSNERMPLMASQIDMMRIKRRIPSS